MGVRGAQDRERSRRRSWADTLMVTTARPLASILPFLGVAVASSGCVTCTCPAHAACAVRHIRPPASQCRPAPCRGVGAEETLNAMGDGFGLASCSTPDGREPVRRITNRSYGSTCASPAPSLPRPRGTRAGGSQWTHRALTKSRHCERPRPRQRPLPCCGPSRATGPPRRKSQQTRPTGSAKPRPQRSPTPPRRRRPAQRSHAPRRLAFCFAPADRLRGRAA